jgi:hypothetical protein
MAGGASRGAARGAILGSPRGAVLGVRRRPTPPPRATLAAGHATASQGWAWRISAWRIWALAAALVLFCQFFQYIVDFAPAYALTKIWPLLVLPLAVQGAFTLALPYRGLLVFTLAWMIGVSPLIGVVDLGNDLAGALATTVKIWAFDAAFAAPALLLLLRPSPAELTRVMTGLGVATYAVMALLWFAVPRRVFEIDSDQVKLFTYDLERGYHIYMPMFFGVLLVFLLNRAFWLRPRLWKLLSLAACFFLLFTIYKERTVIYGAAAIVVAGAILSLPTRRRQWIAGATVAAVGLPLLVLWMWMRSSHLQASLGGSLTTRQAELSKAVAFLNAEPHRWLIGAGSATRVGDVSLADIVGTPTFFLADLGWVGVVFEYGLVGAVLLLALHLCGLQLAWRAAQRRDPGRDPLTRALLDYVLFILLASPVIPVTFLPGEFSTCIAIAWYILHRDGAQLRSPARRAAV